MKLVWLLTKSQFGVYRSRMLLAFLSMMACVCLVVWLVGSFETLRGQFDDKAGEYMGEYSLFISPRKPLSSNAALPDELVRLLAQSPEVARLDAVQQSRLIVVVPEKRFKPGDQPMRDRMGIPPQNPILAGSRIKHAPYEMEAGVWPDMSSTEEAVGVLGEGSAKLFRINVGETLIVFTEAGQFPIKIVGLVKQAQSTPDISSGLGQGAGPAFATLFVPQSLSDKMTGEATRINLLNIRLASGVNTADFKNKLKTLFEEKSFDAGISDIETLHFRLNDNRSVRSSKSQAFSAAGMVLICCIFIIFTTLNMGVNERVRQLALLRALGLGKGQVAGQIIGESFLLSIPAWLGGLGFGYMLLLVLHTALPAAYPSGPQITGLTFLLSGACALGGGLVASIVPAWRATRVAPLEVFPEAEKADAAQARFPLRSALAGLILLSLCPLILTIPGLSPETRKDLYASVGYLALFIGIICLAPALIHLAEKLFSAPVARLLGLKAPLLASQLTRQMSRTVGTTVCLSIGLGLFVAVQCWGYSMVVPFKPTDSIPDVLVSFLPTGIPDSQWDALKHTKGVKPDSFLPLALEQTKIEKTEKNSAHFALVQQDNVLIAGIDPDKAFAGPAPLMNFRFIDGTREEALAKLKQGRHVLLPESLSVATGLKTGDTLRVVPPKHPETSLTYTVAGVIDFPGWHWLTKTSGMRRQEGGFTAGLLLTDFDTARKDYELQNLQFFWMNVEPGTDLRTGNQTPSPKTGKPGAPSPETGRSRGRGPAPSYSGELELAMQTIAEQNAGQLIDIANRGEVRAQKPYAKVNGARNINSRVQERADQVITETSKLPLIGLALTTLALINTLMASVRTRSREFGLLRALGVTRFGLARLILGESFLIGLAAILLSLSFGLVAAWGSINLCRFGYVFGGITPSLVIPWLHLALGFSMTLGLCLLAALWPAFTLSRRSPLQLLQSGDAKAD